MTFRGAPVSVALILICVAIELLLIAAPDLRTVAVNRYAFLVEYGPDGPIASLDIGLLSHAALHGGLLHLGFNMAALAAFGPPVERSVGRLAYLGVFLAAAVAGALAQWLGSAALQWAGAGPDYGGVALVGASGAISGVLALEIYRRDLLLRRMPPIDRPAQPGRYLLQVSAVFLLFNVAIMALPGGISGEAHIGGYLVGLLLAPILLRRPAL